jgi:hypothetical protein
LVECAAHVIGGLDAVHKGAIAGALEVAGQEKGIIFVVFHQQDA